MVEGRRMFEEAPLEEIKKIYVSAGFLDRYGKDKNIADKLEAVGYEVLRDDVYEYASDTKTPQGIMCIMKQKKYVAESILEAPNPLIIFGENIQDPGNLGTIIRTAEGAGVTGIILSTGTADIYNPKVIRSTMGSIFRMPVCYVSDMVATIGAARARGIEVYAAHLAGKESYDAADYKTASAFIIGNEGNGITKECAGAASKLIKIPMKGELESLNAAVAATVLMFEAARQRR